MQKVTSPITHMFSSAARSVLQTLLGVMIFGDILTVYEPFPLSSPYPSTNTIGRNRALSIFVILLGTM
jgi:GDP-fucose transporter C1